MGNRFTRKHITWEEDENGCFNCTSHTKDKRGYVRIGVNKEQTRVHRFIYEECFGFIPKGMVVRHKCDNTSCINPKHLELGTPKENSQDMVKRNRCKAPKGIKSGQAKLTKEQVEEIRNTKGKTRDIARTFGISHGYVSLIKNNKWRKEE